MLETWTYSFYSEKIKFQLKVVMVIFHLKSSDQYKIQPIKLKLLWLRAVGITLKCVGLQKKKIAYK